MCKQLKKTVKLDWSTVCIIIIIIIIIIKAASSDGRDLAPGSPPTVGFRKTGNGEQYAFKIANIEGYVKVI